jgi:cation:H+ antiporter
MRSWPLWLDALGFVVAAFAIWRAGFRLERTASRISGRTGLGQAFTGMLLLAGATSLPEVATTVTAVGILGNPALGVHNLLGGVALQTAILAAADCAKRRKGALTFFSPKFVLLIEGVGLLLLLQLTIAGISAGGVPAVFSISSWLLLLVLAYLGVLYLTYRYREYSPWSPTRTEGSPPEAADEPDRNEVESLRALWFRFAGQGLVVLSGGWFATRSAERLAEASGLGSAFMGASFLALATSLPELSTTIAASRSGRYTTAISNIFGSNAFDVSLLFLAELLYRESSILLHADPSVIFVAVLGSVLTCIYLWGLMERENRTVLGVGWDSGAVLLVYCAGMAVLYSLR